ncbi:hypothetical protein SCP_0906030 [Sparassis crispa]|uniref:Uncharacterized protein n=1 Tax=Sparassis crispa TaxID=139825 RepID=A0A401GX13_9APHY|nr:hypothetical protein SCP_0906030 [Sparassis crispa]GBE86723.1 hypothetical protein SCP_0906030 [Sparassis crispa]
MNHYEVHYQASVASRHDIAAVFLGYQLGVESKYRRSLWQLFTALLILWRFTRCLSRRLAAAQAKHSGYYVPWEPVSAVKLTNTVVDHLQTFEAGPCTGEDIGIGQMKTLQLDWFLWDEVDLQSLMLGFDSLHSSHAQLLWEYDTAISALRRAEQHIRELVDDRRSLSAGLATFYLSLHHRGRIAPSDPRANSFDTMISTHEVSAQPTEMQAHDDVDRLALSRTTICVVSQSEDVPRRRASSDISTMFLAAGNHPLSSASPLSLNFRRPPIIVSLPLAGTTWSAALFPWLALTRSTTGRKMQQLKPRMTPVPCDPSSSASTAESQSVANSTLWQH